MTLTMTRCRPHTRYFSATNYDLPKNGWDVTMLKKWKIIESKRVLKTKWFEIKKDICETPEGYEIPEYFTWRKRDCVIIFPVASEKQVILIRQYRHGVEKICIDYPGGTIDKGQSIFEAASHELYEETGYVAGKFIEIGSFAMDSSYSNQLTHFVIALRCEKKSEPCHPKEVTEIIKIHKSKLQKFTDKEMDCLLCSFLTIKGLTYLNSIK